MRELARLESLLAVSRQECTDYAKRLAEANDAIAALRSAQDVRADMVQAQDTNVVHLDGISVTYEASAHVAAPEAYRLCQEVRLMMVSTGLYVRGDFTIESKRPRGPVSEQ